MNNLNKIERTYIDNSTYGYDVKVTVFKTQKRSRPLCRFGVTPNSRMFHRDVYGRRGGNGGHYSIPTYIYQ